MCSTRCIVAISMTLLVIDVYMMTYIYYKHLDCPPIHPLKGGCNNGHGPATWDVHNYAFGLIYVGIFLKGFLILYAVFILCCTYVHDWDCVGGTVFYAIALITAGSLDLIVCYTSKKKSFRDLFDI